MHESNDTCECRSHLAAVNFCKIVNFTSSKQVKIYCVTRAMFYLYFAPLDSFDPINTFIFTATITIGLLKRSLTGDLHLCSCFIYVYNPKIQLPNND